jgi:hypothetical protein
MVILASEVRIPLWDVGAGCSDETVLKVEVPCRSRCGTKRRPSLLRVMSIEHRSKSAALSPINGDSRGIAEKIA